MNIGELVSEKRKNKGCWWQRALNLVAGCTPVSEACLNCWSAEMAHRQSMRHGISDYQWNLWGGLTTDAGKWSGETRRLHENLSLPKKVKKPTLFSIWNDLFHPDVTDTYLDLAFEVMRDCKQHFFLILTKRPEIARRKIHQSFPNIGIGVTVELSKYLHRIETLLQIPAALHFVSLEPLLGEIKLGIRNMVSWGGKHEINWVIVGCESGRKRRPMQLEWGQKILNECRDAEVPAFLKQIERDGKLIHAPKSSFNLQVFPEVEWTP